MQPVRDEDLKMIEQLLQTRVKFGEQVKDDVNTLVATAVSRAWEPLSSELGSAVDTAREARRLASEIRGLAETANHGALAAEELARRVEAELLRLQSELRGAGARVEGLEGHVEALRQETGHRLHAGELRLDAAAERLEMLGAETASLRAEVTRRADGLEGETRRLRDDMVGARDEASKATLLVAEGVQRLVLEVGRSRLESETNWQRLDGVLEQRNREVNAVHEALRERLRQASELLGELRHEFRETQRLQVQASSSVAERLQHIEDTLADARREATDAVGAVGVQLRDSVTRTSARLEQGDVALQGLSARVGELASRLGAETRDLRDEVDTGVQRSVLGDQALDARVKGVEEESRRRQSAIELRHGEELRALEQRFAARMLRRDVALVAIALGAVAGLAGLFLR